MHPPPTRRRALWARRLAALAGLLVAPFAPAAAQRAAEPMAYPPGALPGTSDTLRYDQFTSIACHNCYNPKVRIGSFTDALAFTTDLELDVHGVWRGPGWDVSHDRTRGKLHYNNCAGWHPRLLRRDPPRPPADLPACLRKVRYWMAAHRDAPVITLYLDLKESDWNQGWAQELDAVLADGLSPYLFTPARLVSYGRPGGHRLPGEAARSGAWPSLGILRGSIIVVLTGGENEKPLAILRNPGNRLLRQYVEERKLAAKAFVAPDVATARQITGVKAGAGFSPGKAGSSAPVDFEDAPQWAAFYNFLYQPRSPGTAEKLGAAGRGTRAVVRMWLEVEVEPFSRQAFCAATRAGIQRMASRRFFKDRLCPLAPDPTLAEAP